MGLGIAIRVGGMPDELVASASFVEVVERVGQPTQFRLEYALDIADGDFPLLKESKLGPGSELQVIVPTTDANECLVKGPVCGQEITFEQAGSGSTLVVVGADSLIKMDREDKAVAWADLTDSDAVTSILSQQGLTPDVEATAAGHMELKHTLIQRETDLTFIRRLARRNGSLFWVTCDEFGVETAHFKRPALDEQPKIDLVMNLSEPRSNVTSLNLSWDVERPVQSDSTEVDLNTKSDITGNVQRSSLTPLGGLGLADVAVEPRVVHVSAPADDAGDLQARSEAALIESSFFVKATGVTTLSALGKVLRSHSLVNMRGIGSRHSGPWFCSAVRHSIDPTEHTMEFELIRNGWAE